MPDHARSTGAVWRLLGVTPGERSLVAWTTALFALAVAAVSLVLNSADSLFFVRFGVQFLPNMILLSGLVVMVVILAYAAGLGQMGIKTWVPATLGSLAIFLMLERVGVGFDLPGIYPVIWLAGQAIMTILFTVIWNIAAEVCDTRQAKRLFPVFASAGIAGGIIGNGLTGPLASFLGTENLLAVAAVLLLGDAASSVVIGRRFVDSGQFERTSVMQSLSQGWRTTTSSQMLRLVAIVGLALNVLYFLVVFPFSEIVTGSFPGEEEVAGFLGIFSALATAATFLVSLLLANRLMRRIGVVGTLLIVPVVYAVGFGLWSASFNLGTASLFRGTQWVAVNALHAAAWGSLFNVLPRRRRGQVMAFITAGPVQLGTVASGIVLIAGSSIPQLGRFATGWLIAAAAGVAVWLMRSAYKTALVDAVKLGFVDVFTVPIHAFSQTTAADAIAALQESLEDERPEVRVMAVTMLSRLDDLAASRRVETAMKDPDSSVRAAAVIALARQDQLGDMDLSAVLADADPAVRRLGLELIRDSDMDPPPGTTNLLTDPDPKVRGLAAALTGDGDVIEELLDSTSPTHVMAGLEAIALRPELADRDLSTLVNHPNRRVRRAACAAVAGTPGSAPMLRPLLDDSSMSTRRAAADSLATWPEGRATLRDALEVGSVRATEVALRALVESEDSADLTPWAAIEIARAQFLNKHRASLQQMDAPSEMGAFLIRLLRTREQRVERWAVIALTAGGSEQSTDSVTRGLWSADPETRSQALEALDSIADRRTGRELLDLLEGEDRTTLDPVSSLRELSTDFDPWIRGLGVRCLAERLKMDLAQLGQIARADPSPLVREGLRGWEISTMHEAQTLDRMERVVALTGVPMFGDIDPEDLERLAEVTTERHFEPDEMIYREDEEGDEMTLVVRGEVLASRRRNGKTETIRRFGPGEHVGELSLLRGQPRISDVVAGPDGAHTLALGSMEFQAILEERPEVAVAMLGTLAERLATS